VGLKDARHRGRVNLGGQPRKFYLGGIKGEDRRHEECPQRADDNRGESGPPPGAHQHAPSLRAFTLGQAIAHPLRHGVNWCTLGSDARPRGIRHLTGAKGRRLVGAGLFDTWLFDIATRTTLDLDRGTTPRPVRLRALSTTRVGAWVLNTRTGACRFGFPPSRIGGAWRPALSHAAPPRPTRSSSRPPSLCRIRPS